MNYISRYQYRFDKNDDIYNKWKLSKLSLTPPSLVLGVPEIQGDDLDRVYPPQTGRDRGLAEVDPDNDVEARLNNLEDPG